jgi:uncharacterized protein
MIAYLRVRSPWSQFGIFLGLLGAAFIGTSVLMAIILMLNGVPLASMQTLDLNEPKVLKLMKLIQALSSIVIFMVPALGFGFIVFRKRPLYFLGVKRAVNPKMYLLAAFLIVAAFPTVFWLGELNQALPLPKWMTGMEEQASKQMEAFLKARTTMDVIWNVILIALLPAVCEELCFRGALQRIVINLCRNPWAGIIVTAILFSALHLQFQGFLPRMFLGVLLGALYWYSGSLWTSIIAHFINNAVQVIAVSYAPAYVNKNPSMPIVVAFASVVLIIGIVWVYKSFSRITYPMVYGRDDLNEFNQFIA